MLQLEQLSCGYGPVEAVRGLSLSVAPGATFALLGANGAGKSSTIMAVAGHVAVQGGRIVFDGRDLTAAPVTARIAAGIALVPEGRRLFPDLSVAENLVIGGYHLPKARSAENRERALSLFPRLGERLQQRAGSLSGGEQQMLAIARALMAEPKLLMIDELSLGLMPKMVDLCYRAIAALKAEGLTLVLVEQNTSRALEVADQVCVLQSGEAVWQGSAAEARQKRDLLGLYLGFGESAEGDAPRP